MITTHELIDMPLCEAIDAQKAAKDDLKRIYKCIAEYRETAYSISSPQNDGMPKAHGNRTSKTEKAAIRLAELEKIAEGKQADIMRYKRIIYRHICEIEDSHMRILLTLHFVDGYSWMHISKELKDGNSAEANKKAVFRFLRDYKNGGRYEE